ncbi:unnamed protein product [Calypogeia fissa]
MAAVTACCCSYPRLPSHLFKAQISTFFARCSAQPLKLRRRIRFYCSSSEMVEETCEGISSRRAQVDSLLERRWLLEQPSTKMSKVLINSTKPSGSELPEHLGQRQFNLQGMTPGMVELGKESDGPMFYVIRDDLLHPLLGGNKLRKLDALLPILEDCKATDVITCGGCQSAHTAALAFACAERGITAHLLLRGERPAISTGYNLLARMYGRCTYVPRSEYADRAAMFKKYGGIVGGSSSSLIWLDDLGERPTVGPISEKKVVVVNEGAGDAIALLGLIRLIHYLSQPTVFGSSHQLHIVVDTGTGTTAVGLALGISLLRLPWTVTGVILADTVEGHEAHKHQLISKFCERHSSPPTEALHLPLSWTERWKPRKFGRILPGEVRTCQSIAQQTGILLDPIYTLAGWETGTRLSLESWTEGKGSEIVVMLHTGGTLGLFGLAQRYPEEFE